MISSTASMLRQIDMTLIDDLFEMGDGYVLNFSDATYSQFFARELGINIDDAKYKQAGTSKAKRLRCLLNISDPATIVRNASGSLGVSGGASQAIERARESKER